VETANVAADPDLEVCESDCGIEDLQEVARLTDPGFYAAEPYDVYARLRREAPVFWYEAGEIWGVSRYEDARFVLGRPELFSSKYGLIYTQSMTPDDGSACPVSDMPRRAQMRGRAFQQFLGDAHETLVTSDPPRHTSLRRLVSPAFTPRLVAKLGEGVHSLVQAALDTIEPEVVTDVVDAFARPVPMYVIAQMLGVPREDWVRFARWSDAIFDASSQLHDPQGERSAHWMEQLLEFAAYFGEQLADRRANPRDDVLTAIQGEVEGEVLSDIDQLMFALQVLAAGNETTQTLIAAGVKLLAEHPDQCSILVEDPGLIPNAVEEMLRCASPVPTFCRTAKETTHLRGTRIEKGDFVVVIHAAANRDEDVWEEADRFLVTRKPDAGIAFGFGPHFCLGAALARLEARVVFTELLRRYPKFELAGPACRSATSAAPRYEAMPVVFHRP
jgi:cytochrome P450